MSAVPRSGCLRTRRVGTPAMIEGTMRSFIRRSSVRGSSCRYFASAMMRNSFMNSLGWKPKLPMLIERELPRMSFPG